MHCIVVTQRGGLKDRPLWDSGEPSMGFISGYGEIFSAQINKWNANDKIIQFKIIYNVPSYSKAYGPYGKHRHIRS